MTRTQEIQINLNEGIDRQTLTHLRERFLRVNQGRLLRALEGLTPRQQTVLSLLPLFFHVNHPLLPGYVSGSTPAGVAGYEPDTLSLAEAQRLTRSFSYKARTPTTALPIHGLFLMGSLGTLAQTDQSDMDVWVCHGPDLGESALDELRKKCQLLEAWAAGLGADAHFFLIDGPRFALGERDARLSTDDCGTTQHYLLLDEFYRTAIWLAGRTPMWWWVPACEESHYAQFTHTLLSKRFIRADEAVDLGHLARIPPGEFVGAGLWQLFKGIESPYKSVLKLLLIEVYASEHPKVECLSLRFKQSVYANQLDLDELDPYVVVYRRIEQYLKARGDVDRLELVRRSLYLKVNRKLTASIAQRGTQWQRQLLARLTTEWGWDQRQLAWLDSRPLWKAEQAIHERRALVHELNYSYRFLSQFARDEQAAGLTNKRDLNVLGRRLYAAFERKAGKVDHINPGIAPNLAQDLLTLVHSPNKKEPGEHHWGVYRGNLAVHEWEHTPAIRRSPALLELLAWCHRNGVIDSSTRLALNPGSTDVTEYELFNLLGCLQQLIALPLAAVDETQLLRPSIPAQVLIVVNVGIDPLKHHREMNIVMTTERTDSLSYAGVRENLVLTLDQVTLNSWNEVIVSRFDGEHALFDCLTDYLNAQPHGRETPELRVRCVCHNRAQFIAHRVEGVFNTAQALRLSGRAVSYVVQVEQRFHVMELARGEVRHVALADSAALVGYLSQSVPAYRAVHLDAMALGEHDLGLMLPKAKPGAIQVFYRLNDGRAELTVLDECNVVWQQTVPFHDELSLLVPLQRFVQALLFRREACQPLEDNNPAAALEVLYYQLLPSGTGRVRSIEARRAPVSPANSAYYEVQAIIGKGAHGGQWVTLYCNQREFSQMDHGDQLYGAVAREIIGQRRETERYRCYITDLDLSGLLGESHSPSHLYLRYKANLEQALNEALAQV